MKNVMITILGQCYTFKSCIRSGTTYNWTEVYLKEFVDGTCRLHIPCHPYIAHINEVISSQSRSYCALVRGGGGKGRMDGWMDGRRDGGREEGREGGREIGRERWWEANACLNILPYSYINTNDVYLSFILSTALTSPSLAIDRTNVLALSERQEYYCFDACTYSP